MSEMIQQLHTDHVNMARLLDIVEEQFELFQTGEIPDYVLMLDVMQYMTNYPDLFHHPREDLVFQRLAERDKSKRGIVQDVIREHDILAHQGEAFFNLLETVINEYPVERGELESKARQYVSTLRLHMNLEEGEVFPIAKKTLQEEDWQAISTTMGNREEPLFGQNVIEAEYGALYRYIQSCK